MIDSAQYRHVLGHYPSGVVVVTAMGAEGPIGMTLQSFHALSISPPLIALFPAKSSSTWKQIAASGNFCVNILSAAQSEIALRFARPAENRFEGLSFDLDGAGAPRLAGAQAHLSCKMHAVYEGGDHEVVVGALSALVAHEGIEPLLFYRGRFRALGPEG